MNVEALRSALLASRATIDSVLAQLTVKEGSWLTVQEAARYTGVSAHMIRSQAKAGVLKHKLTDGGGKMYVWIEKSA